MMANCIFVGSVCLDRVLQVESYPAEDSECTVVGQWTDWGGNATNAARGAARLRRFLDEHAESEASPSHARAPVGLVVPLPLPSAARTVSHAHESTAELGRLLRDQAEYRDSVAFLDDFRGMGVRVWPIARGCAGTTPDAAHERAGHATGHDSMSSEGARGDNSGASAREAPARLPVSMIVCTRDTGTRTIMHSRGQRCTHATTDASKTCAHPSSYEYEAEELVSAVRASLRSPARAFVHMEGRSLPATRAVLDDLLGRDVLVSLEIEKERPGGVMSLLTHRSVSLVFVSREYARTCMHATDPQRICEEVGMFMCRARTPGCAARRSCAVVVPWGAAGAWVAVHTRVCAGACTDACDCEGAHRFAWRHVHAHAPSMRAPDADSIGAGDTFMSAVAVACARVAWQQTDAFHGHALIDWLQGNVDAEACMAAALDAVCTAVSLGVVVAGEKVGVRGLDVLDHEHAQHSVLAAATRLGLL